MPKVSHSANGERGFGKAMVIRAHGRGVKLRLIELGKPN